MTTYKKYSSDISGYEKACEQERFRRDAEREIATTKQLLSPGHLNNPINIKKRALEKAKSKAISVGLINQDGNIIDLKKSPQELEIIFNQYYESFLRDELRKANSKNVEFYSFFQTKGG